MSNHDPVDTHPDASSDAAPNTAAQNDGADESRDKRSDEHSDETGKGRGIAGKIAAYFIDSPLTPLLLLATLGIGILGLLTTPRQEDPDISVPMVDIKLRYPGASSGQVARLAVEPLERMMSELDAVEHVYSVSRREEGLVTVRFEVGTPIDPAVVAVHDTIESNLDQVPPDLTEWLVQPKTIDDVPVLTLTLWSEEIHDARLRMLGLQLLQELKQVENTGNGFVVGGRKREIGIEPQPDRLRGTDSVWTSSPRPSAAPMPGAAPAASSKVRPIARSRPGTTSRAPARSSAWSSTPTADGPSMWVTSPGSMPDPSGPIRRCCSTPDRVIQGRTPSTAPAQSPSRSPSSLAPME